MYSIKKIEIDLKPKLNSINQQPDTNKTDTDGYNDPRDCCDPYRRAGEADDGGVVKDGNREAKEGEEGEVAQEGEAGEGRW